MQITDNETNQTELRVIKTARSENAINEAVEQGFRPLVKPVIPSPDIRVKFAVSQNKTTGRITVGHDYRDSNIESPIKPVAEFPKPTQDEIDSFNLAFPHVPYSNSAIEEETVIGWTYYYPYQFESPFAAYLIPHDLQIGETVFLEDLIEDVIGSSWNQGDAYRLTNCKAIWDGKDFILQYGRHVQKHSVIG
jgi:hypothetical protein